MKKGRVELGRTPIRYDLKNAREAASAYNRHCGFLSVSLSGGRLTIEQMVSGQNSPLFKGDLDALVFFLHHGLVHRDDTLQAYDDVERLLGHYIRHVDDGGKGGALLDFYEPIVEALIACGVMEKSDTSADDMPEAETRRRPHPVRQEALPEEESAV